VKVVILAGGLGTRLSEETASKPKPMVEIGERPILWHIMKMYRWEVTGEGDSERGVRVNEATRTSRPVPGTSGQGGGRP
jgi:hypothetical protein